MSTLKMPQTPTMTSTMPNLSTPGSMFLNKKIGFHTQINDFNHYKLDSISPTDGYNSLPNKKRTAINVVFNPIKNDLDPYVHASNWLPKFKAHCKGYIARKNTEELRKKHEAVRIIQRAAEEFLDPLLQIFYTIRPTLKILKMDELKKYLRQCVIHIKKLNAERMFIENHLDDVENTLDKSMNINNDNCLSLEGRKSPNIFGKMSEIKANVNNDDFLKECLDLKIDGLDNIEIHFDQASCQNSKIHAVYEKSDKLQLKIHENQHKLQTLIKKCENLEKEIKDLRNGNSTLDSTNRIMKGIIHKHDREKEEQIIKITDLEDQIKKITEVKFQTISKIKEYESSLSSKTETIVELTSKCEYLENELDKKIKTLTNLNQEKANSEKRIKELEETVIYNNEIQQELEANYEQQKNKLKEAKKRFTEQLKTVEEDLISEKNSSKIQIQDLGEQIELLNEKIKNYEQSIRRLEREVNESNDKNGSDEEMDFERERKLSMQLKMSHANMESLKEDLKIMENYYEEAKKKNQEFENNLEVVKQQETEGRKQIERLKSQIQTLKSSFSETELNLNRANREKNFINQKWNQSRDLNVQHEAEISKLNEELNNQSQTINQKLKEIENLELELSSSKKEYESKLSALDKIHSESQDQCKKTNEKLVQLQEEMKKNSIAYQNEVEELKQQLYDKDMEMDNASMDNLKHAQTIKKLQKRIEEQDQIQVDCERTIAKLKDDNKNLREEKDNLNTRNTYNSIVVSDHRSSTLDFLNRESRISRSSSNITTPSPSSNDKFFTLPTRGGSSKHQS